MADNTKTTATETVAPAETEQKAAQPLDMSVSVRLIEPKGKLLGFANVTLNNAVTIVDFKVLRGEDGALYVGMPSKPDQGSRTGYANTARILDNDTKQQLTEAVVTGYNAEVVKTIARAAAIAADQEHGAKPPRIADQVKSAAKEAAEHNAARPVPAKEIKDKSAVR